MDFTIKKYRDLLSILISNKYQFKTFKEFLEDTQINKNIILRHDVDKLPSNSLKFAKIQYDLDISGVYYFRAVSQSWNEKIIREISELGHEVGYHYENMDTCKGNIDKAWDDFRFHLDNLRELVEVKTICMHGSPLSKFDNKEIWQKFVYKSLDIIGEPYFDINFNNCFYMTDTGRRWDGWNSSVRDKVAQQDQWFKKNITFHSTDDIIRSIQNDEFPDIVMFNFHPQRWHDSPFQWGEELIFQNIKNLIKKYFFA